MEGIALEKRGEKIAGRNALAQNRVPALNCHVLKRRVGLAVQNREAEADKKLARNGLGAGKNENCRKDRAGAEEVVNLNCLKVVTSQARARGNRGGDARGRDALVRAIAGVSLEAEAYSANQKTSIEDRATDAAIATAIGTTAPR